MSWVHNRIVTSWLPNGRHEILHLALRARVETGGRLVQQQQHRRGQKRAGECDLLLHAAGEILHRLGRRRRAGIRPASRISGMRATRLVRREAVEAGGIAEVLHRRHALEERRLHRHPIDQPLHLPGVVGHVDPEYLAVPPSFRSSVERSRTKVDLPEPFWPRMATHSPRAMVKLMSRSAGTRRRRTRARPMRRPSRRMNSLRRSQTSTAGSADTRPPRREGDRSAGGRTVAVRGAERWRCGGAAAGLGEDVLPRAQPMPL